MKKQEREFSIAVVALVISIASAGFSGLQWWESHQTRIADRAVVHVKTISLTQPKATEVMTTSVVVENVGKTTAKHLTAIANIGLTREAGLLDTGDIRKTQPPIPIDLTTGDTATVEAQTDRGPTDQEVQDVQSGVRFIYTWGHLEYFDVFGNPHKTTLCARYNPHNSSGKTDACPNFNSIE